MDEIPFHVPRFRVRRLPASELRKDPIAERWVIVSTDRLGRPTEGHVELPPARLESCPFCGGHEHLTPGESYAVAGPDGWRVRVVPNAYPMLRPIDGDSHGTHEVVIECPQHEPQLANLPADHIADVFRAYRERIRAARGDSRIVYPVVFKNCGPDAGASLEHAHSQILMMPRVPDAVAAELAGAAAHHAATGHCAFCDLIDRERQTGERWVMESERFVALVAYAGRFPFETWALPKSHGSHFDATNDADLADLGVLLHRLLRALAVGLDLPPYNYYIHTAPLNDAAASYHWHVEMLPRLTGTAGFEWGTGWAVNPVPPEQAAAYLRMVFTTGHTENTEEEKTERAAE